MLWKAVVIICDFLMVLLIAALNFPIQVLIRIYILRPDTCTLHLRVIHP